jgi:hypothetical protein
VPKFGSIGADGLQRPFLAVFFETPFYGSRRLAPALRATLPAGTPLRGGLGASCATCLELDGLERPAPQGIPSGLPARANRLQRPSPPHPFLYILYILDLGSLRKEGNRPSPRPRSKTIAP